MQLVREKRTWKHRLALFGVLGGLSLVAFALWSVQLMNMTTVLSPQAVSASAESSFGDIEEGLEFAEELRISSGIPESLTAVIEETQGIARTQWLQHQVLSAVSQQMIEQLPENHLESDSLSQELVNAFEEEMYAEEVR